MPFEQKVIKVSPATYNAVTAVKIEMAAEKHRQVTFDEAVEYLLTFRQAALALTTEAGK